MDLLRKEIIGVDLEARIVQFLDTDAAADMLLEILLTLSSFMARISTIMRRKTDTTMEPKELNTEFASENPIDTVGIHKDLTESSLSSSDSGSDETLRWKVDKTPLETSSQQAQQQIWHALHVE